MAMVCPQCSRSFDQHLLCPTCGTRLLFQANLGTATGDEESQWQHTPWGRLIVGLLLAQGLTHGLRMFATAGVLVTSTDVSQVVWQTLFGLVTLHAIQGLSLLIGGAIAGAGQQRGLLYGTLIGLLNGVIFLVTMTERNQALPPMVEYGQPLLHVFFGALGGLLGRLIWKPLPTVRLVLAPESPAKVDLGSRSENPLLAGPIAWTRVMAGTAVVIAGLVWSQSILTFVLDASQGKLTIKTHLQAQLIGFEITALAALFGAGLAGATTNNGFKQGLCVGIGAAVVLIGMQLGTETAVLENTVLLVISTVSLSLAGGWFGGQLFPPVYAGRRRHIAAP
jgi:hypothetical protein